MRVIIDTNILLDGLFINASNSRQILMLIQNGVIEGYIIKNNLYEARKKITELFEQGVDLRHQFFTSLYFLKLFYLDYVPAVISISYDKINGDIYDKALAAKAHDIDAILCTKDIKDLSPASEYGVTVKTPGALVKEITSDGSLSLSDIFQGFFHTPCNGTFFIEVTPAWSALIPKGKEPFFYAEGVGCLFYDFPSKCIVFELDDGFQATIKVDYIIPSLTISISVSYNNEKGVRILVDGEHEYFSHTWECAKASSNNINPLHDKSGNGIKLGLSIKNFYSYPNFMKAKDILRVGNQTVHEYVDRVSLDSLVDKKSIVLPW